MATSRVTRRAFSAALASFWAVSDCVSAQDGWTQLFDGRSLEGWRPSEHKDSWTVEDGALSANGPRSHLFYVGPFHNADFRNFELEVEVMTRPSCNSGVYFHTAYQETNFPQKGFEIQIDNTYVGEGNYRERKMGGSLYGLRNVYKQLVSDNEWFKINALVRGKNIQIRMNGMLLVDYTEPTPPVIPDGMERERFLSHGTFALQCHNTGSLARFRSVRVRPLPDDTPTPPGLVAVVDDLFRQIIDAGRHGVPTVDYHVRLANGLTLEQALARSRRDGFMYGIAAACGQNSAVKNDAAARAFVDRLKGKPLFVGMQAEDREWTRTFTRAVAAQFEYIIGDATTWYDDSGRLRQLTVPGHIGTIADPQAFMDLLATRTVEILDREPIDIFGKPTFLPAVISKDYDKLWTEERMTKVIDAVKRNQVAIELNERFRVPNAAFVRIAKAAGCKFAFGTDNTGPDDLRRCDYGMQLLADCKLGSSDFFVPRAWWPKAIDRKGEALHA